MNVSSAQLSRAERFRSANLKGRLLLPNAWDAASARVLEAVGFEGVATTSAGIAYARGYPDAEQMSAEAMLAEIAAIARAVEAPVTADIEAGYGDVEGTVRAVINAGAVGVNIEDRDYASGPTALATPSDQAARISSARSIADAAGLPLTINARTDTFMLAVCDDVDSRIEETIERGRAYLAAGADLVFVPLLLDPVMVARVSQALDGRLSLMAVPGAPPASALFDAGARRLTIAHVAMLLAYGALRDAAVRLKATGDFDPLGRGAFSFAEASALFAR
jgi:2-methylisocitrate lyase-like PEP mutase family enzyme